MSIIITGDKDEGEEDVYVNIINISKIFNNLPQTATTSNKDTVMLSYFSIYSSTP